MSRITLTVRLVVLVSYIVTAIVLAVPVVVVTVRQPDLLLPVLVPYVALAVAGVGAVAYLGNRTGVVNLIRPRISGWIREQAPFMAIGLASGVVSSSAANFVGTHPFAMILIGLVGAMVAVMVFAVVRIIVDGVRSGSVGRND